MSQPLDLRDAGRLVARMLTERATPGTREDFDLVHRHHDRVLDALVVLLRAGARLHRDRRQEVTLREISDRPAHALLGTLEQFPRQARPFPAEPSLLLGSDGPAAGGWRDLHATLLVTAHDWTHVRGTPPEPVQWGVLADVAAIAGALSFLQEDFAAVMTRLGRPSAHAAGLRLAAPGLRVSADAALDRALLGPTADRWTPTPPAPTEIVQVNHPTRIAAAATMLARTLATPQLRLSSSDLTALLATHALTTQIFAQAAHRLGQDTSAELYLHAHHLAAAGREATGKLWSQLPAPDRIPIVQARALHLGSGRQLQDLLTTRAGTPHPPVSEDLVAAVAAYAAIVPAITAGLQTQINAAFAGGSWAILDRESTTLEVRWRPTRGTDLPTLQSHVEAAVAAVAELGPRSVYPDTTSSSSTQTPHVILTALRRPPARGWIPDIPGRPGSRGIAAHRPDPPTLTPPPHRGAPRR